MNMNVKNLSTTAKRVQTLGVGYRYEGISTGVYRIEDCLRFEVEELGNEDVFETLNKLYNINTNDIEKVIKWVYSMFKERNIYGLWVSTKIGVEKNYIDENEYSCGPVTLLKYKLPQKGLILSDLDDQGVWFAISEHPDKLLYQEVQSTKYKGIW